METSESRRAFLRGAASLGALALAGCTTTSKTTTAASHPMVDPAYLDMYAAMPDERFPIDAADLSQVDPAFLRRVVDDPTGARPGSVVVDTAERYLYLVREDGKAIRYGAGIGRAGFAWSGSDGASHSHARLGLAHFTGFGRRYSLLLAGRA